MITIGTDSLTGKPYRIDPERHINVIGATGVGKSALLERIFIEFIRQGNGGVFFDVHGDAADRLKLLTPSARIRDFIFLDPSEDFVPVFNPLFFADPEELELAKETCLALLKALAGNDTAWGNETPHNLKADLDAVCEHVQNPTLVHVYRFLIDEDYRARLLDSSRNPFLKLFTKAFNKLRSNDQSVKLAPAINKVSKLMRPTILPILGSTNSLDPLDLMNQRKILVCRLSKGRLGEETAMILYSLIVSMFSIAALRREKQTDRPPFIIVADEAQNGVHGGRFGTLLAEARKYGISLVTAFQGSYQMPIIRDILTNSATQIIFNASGEDADMIVENWRSEKLYSPGQITQQSRYEFWARTFNENQPLVTQVKALPALKPRRADPSKLLNHSYERWATDKHQTLKNIEQVLRN